MIVVTGALGFIGSCMIRKLNEEGFEVLAVDDFYKDYKEANLANKEVREWIHRDIFLKWLPRLHARIEMVIHLGARTDTTEMNTAVFDKLNLNCSKNIWQWCTEFQKPLIYASSAATYGMGEHGFSDSHKVVNDLTPLNPYGVSKNEFDKWALEQTEMPPFWTGLKFFNVYGPNEYHKKRMASVVFHTVQQIQETGGMKLFRSHDGNYKDGEQQRDFVYVKDVVNVIHFLMQNKPKNGLYNVGTGKARTFQDLASATFKAMDLEPNISFIDTPKDIRDKYQYYTQAKMTKLKKAGYKEPFYSLEDGIADYVQNYLLKRTIY